MIVEEYILKRNNFIGELGEMCFTQCVSYAHRTRGKDLLFLDKVPFSVPEQIKAFLKKYWYTLDAFRFAPTEQHFLEIFEVKTTHLPFSTSSSSRMYGLTGRQIQAFKEAAQLGIKITEVRVQLLPNWRIQIETRPFSFDNFFFSEGGPNSKIKNKIPRD